MANYKSIVVAVDGRKKLNTHSKNQLKLQSETISKNKFSKCN